MTDRNLHGAIDDAMRYDPLSEAEKTVEALTGVKSSYKEKSTIGKAIVGLGLTNMQKNAETKRQLAKVNRDTSFSCNLQVYFDVAKDLGFKQVFKMEIPKHDQTRETDHYFIFVTSDGLVLTFDSYGGDRINGGKLLFNWASNDPENRYPGAQVSGSTRSLDKEKNEILSREFKYEYDDKVSRVAVDEWRDYRNGPNWTVWVGDYDCREFLRRKVDGLRAHGELLKTWAKRPFLWFLHYNDTRCLTCGEQTNNSAIHNRCTCVPQSLYDYEAITAQRIKDADPMLAKILGSE